MVIGDDPPPERLLARATHVMHVPAGDLTPDVVAQLRTRIPRQVAIVGPDQPAARAARLLHGAGLPVTLYVHDEPTARTGLEGIEVLPLNDARPQMQVADSLLDLVGDTPLVRLDRVGRNLACELVAKLDKLGSRRKPTQLDAVVVVLGIEEGPIGQRLIGKIRTPQWVRPIPLAGGSGPAPPSRLRSWLDSLPASGQSRPPCRHPM